MDKKEMALAIEQICEEKGLTKEDVKATIENALAAAYRKDFGDKKTQNIKTSFNIDTGDFEVFDVKEVVEDELKEKYEKIKIEIEKLKEAGEEITPELLEELQGKPKSPKHENTESTKSTDKDKESTEESSDEEVEEEEEKKFNPRTMVSLSEAKKIEANHKIGDLIVTKLEVPSEFGRMAAQTAKQVIIQKIREAERNTIFDEFKDKIGELLVGTVQRKEGRVVYVDFGHASACMLPNDQNRLENYKSGARMKFYLKSVEQTSKGPQILVSRSSVEFLRKLFKLEVPEISEGSVVIKSIARDAGSRSKVAVFAKEENLDPIGSCIGQRGSRIQTIINELNGEKVDVIEWDEDEAKFIENALAPAKVDYIEIIEEGDENKEEEEETHKNKVAKAHVPEDQYSLAIGKGGQNVRLAAQLVGMKIDVVMEEGEKVEGEETLAGGGEPVESKKTKEETPAEEVKSEKTEEVKKEKVEEPKEEVVEEKEKKRNKNI